jgi:DNA-binding MarR family transcriptional regulator
MTREEVFKFIQEVDHPQKDYGKILSCLHYTHHFLMDKYKKIVQNYNLTFTQSNILGIIVHSYPKALSLEQIKAMVLEPNADVSRTVARLVEKDFVEKVIDKTNRRKVSIKATAKGIKISRKMAEDPGFRNITHELSLPEAKAFIRTLKKLRLQD